MGEIAGYAGDAVGEMAGYAGDAASEVADATLHSGVRGGAASTSEGSHFEIDASEVNAIDLNWLAGSGSVRVVPDSETDRQIVVERNDARRSANPLCLQHERPACFLSTIWKATEPVGMLARHMGQQGRGGDYPRIGGVS